ASLSAYLRKGIVTAVPASIAMLLTTSLTSKVRTALSTVCLQVRTGNSSKVCSTDMVKEKT
ncbi:MAG: hypothetical protein ACI9VL_001020, partial [Colwellia sp.]